jgi:hypothetical protein
VITAPLLSSEWFLACDWLALDSLWVAPTDEFQRQTEKGFPNVKATSDLLEMEINLI